MSATGHAAPRARCTSAGGTGTAAGQRAAQRSRSTQTGVEQPRERRRHERHERHVVLAQRLQHPVGVEALVHDRRRRVDARAQQDRKAADVAHRQRAQPALARGRGQARRQSRARSTGSCRSVSCHRARRGGRAGGVDHDGRRVQVVTDRRRSRAAAGARAPGRARGRAAGAQRLVDEHRGAARDRGPLAAGPGAGSTGTATAPSSRHACSAWANASPGASAIATRVAAATPPRALSSCAPPRAAIEQLVVGPALRRLSGSRRAGGARRRHGPAIPRPACAKG